MALLILCPSSVRDKNKYCSYTFKCWSEVETVLLTPWDDVKVSRAQGHRCYLGNLRVGKHLGGELLSDQRREAQRFHRTIKEAPNSGYVYHTAERKGGKKEGGGSEEDAGLGCLNWHLP